MRPLKDIPSLHALGPFRFGIYFGFTNAFNWMIALGAPMVLMAEQLGASAFQAGLLYSAVFLLLPVQLLSTALLPHLGYRRQMLFAWSTRSVFLLVPFFLALRAPEDPTSWMLHIYIVAIFGFCFFRAIGACALLPWLYEVLPPKIQGRYFGMDSLVVGLAGVITLLFSSILFGLFESFTAYRVLFFLTLVAATTSMLNLAKLPDGARPKVVSLAHLAARAPQLCFRPSHYRRFLRLQMLYAIAGYAFVPFSIYYLKTTLQFSQSYILALTAIQFVGMFAASMILKEWVGRIGAKPFFIVSHITTIGFQLFWGCMVLLPGYAEPALPIIYFFVGIAMASFLTATNAYLPQICRPKERALSISLLSSVVGLIGGVASTGWGFILKDPETGFIRTSLFVSYFGVALCIQIFLLIAYTTLKERNNCEEALPTHGVMVRPFRYLVSFINLVEQPLVKRSKK